MTDNFRQLYAAFGRSVGQQGLDVDAYGEARLDIDGVRLRILHLEQAGEALLSARVATLPAHPPESLLTWLLTESLEQYETRGVAFAIESDRNAVMALRRLSTLGLAVEDFSREIETLVSLAETAAREIEARATTFRGDLGDKTEDRARFQKV
jgi:hypothetical protein